MLGESQLVIQSFYALCYRILDIDESCGRLANTAKGCPAHLAAIPMIRDWQQHHHHHIPAVVDVVIQRMLSADGQGRWCEFPEIKDYAEAFLKHSAR